MKKIICKCLFFMCMFNILFSMQVHSKSLNKIVNEDMGIDEIIDVAKDNDIIVNINNIYDKEKIVDVINEIYFQYLSDSDIACKESSKAIDGQIRTVSRVSKYNGIMDTNGNGFKYSLDIHSKIEVYSDASGHREIVGVLDGETNPKLNTNIGNITSIDTWSIIAPNGTYARIHGGARINKWGSITRIVEYSVNVYP